MMSQTKHTRMNYPLTKKDTTTTTYFDTQIKDPYRWLENDKSSETAVWIQNQNKITFNYLDQIPFRDSIKNRLEKLWNYEKLGTPFTEGTYTYFYKNNGLQNQYVLYRKKGDETPTVFLDPNTFSKDGTTSLSTIRFTEDGSLAAYAISEGGSDWRKIIVIDTETLNTIGETLVDVKFSGISWKGNDGFYYSSYDKPIGSELSAKTDQHKLYYHKLGTPQEKDILVFGAVAEEKHRYVSGSVTKDQKYLIISAAVSTSGNKLFIKDLTIPNSNIIPILNHTKSDTYIIENIDTKLYLVTNLNAPNKKIVTVDASNPKIG